MPITDEQLIEAGIRHGLLTATTLAGLRLLARRNRTRLIEVVTQHGRFPAAALYQGGLPPATHTDEGHRARCSPFPALGAV